MADIVVLGSVPAGEAVLRSGASARRPVYVTGTLGESSVASLNRFGPGKSFAPNRTPSIS